MEYDYLSYLLYRSHVSLNQCSVFMFSLFVENKARYPVVETPVAMVLEIPCRFSEISRPACGGKRNTVDTIIAMTTHS